MTRHHNNPHYGPDEDDVEYTPKSGRSHGREYALARPDPRSTMHPGRPHSSAGSQNGANSAGTARRRIPVACGRCRKRKIRCSGDQGDGLCLNCKQANIPQGGCMFLRVQCEMRDLLPDHVQVLMRDGYKQAGSSSLDLHPYVTATASASAPSLSLAAYEPTLQAPHQGPNHIIRNSHSATTLNPNYHHSSNGILSLKPMYAQEQPHPGSNSESTSDLHLGSPNVITGDAEDGNTSSVYDGSYPTFMLPGIAHNLTGSSATMQWTPLSNNNAHRVHSNLFLDQEQSNNSQYITSTRMSPHVLDAFVPPPNIFPALNHLSDNLPPAQMLGTSSSNGYTPKQSDKIILPSPPVFPRSQSLDMSVLSSRSTSMNSANSSLTDPSLTNGYHTASNSGNNYKNYAWSAEPTMPTYTFNTPSKTLSASAVPSHYSTEISRGSPQPSQALASHSIAPAARSSSSSYPSGYSTMPLSYSGQSSASYPISSNTALLPSHSATVLNAVTVTTSDSDPKREKYLTSNEGNATTGSSAATGGPSSVRSSGSSVPASPYSSSPTSSMYGTPFASRSQPQTPIPTRSASDKGCEWIICYGDSGRSKQPTTAAITAAQAEEDHSNMGIDYTLRGAGYEEYSSLDEDEWIWEDL